MSNFTPLVKKEYEFQGDKIVVTFSRLKRKHMINAIPAMNRLTDAQESNNQKEVAAAMNDFINDVIDVVPEYVKDFHGLNDSEGAPISIETVINDFYFLKLAIEISMDMIRESSPGNEGNV